MCCGVLTWNYISNWKVFCVKLEWFSLFDCCTDVILRSFYVVQLIDILVVDRP